MNTKIRQHFRQARQALDLQTRQSVSQTMAEHEPYHQGSEIHHIGLYHANDGEIDPVFLAEKIWAKKKSGIFL